MSLNKDVNAIVIARIEKLKEALSSGQDFRKCLSLLPPIAFPLKGYLDISNKPDEVFRAYIIVDQMGNVQSAYDGHSQQWYELNKDNIEEFQAHLKKFAKMLVDSLKNDNEATLIAAVKEFFFNFNQLARATTTDQNS